MSHVEFKGGVPCRMLNLRGAPMSHVKFKGGGSPCRMSNLRGGGPHVACRI